MTKSASVSASARRAALLRSASGRVTSANSLRPASRSAISRPVVPAAPSMKTLCVIALARPLAAANRRFVTFGREARDHVGEWLGFRGHPMLDRVNQSAGGGPAADMDGEDDQVAPLALVGRYVGFGHERRQ